MILGEILEIEVICQILGSNRGGIGPGSIYLSGLK